MSHVVQGNHVSPTSPCADSDDPKNRSVSLPVLWALLLLVLLSYLALVANVSVLTLVRIQLHTVADTACLATTLVSNIPVPFFFVPVRATPEGSKSRTTP